MTFDNPFRTDFFAVRGCGNSEMRKAEVKPMRTSRLSVTEAGKFSTVRQNAAEYVFDSRALPCESVPHTGIANDL